jgi:lipopolysaccharide assembly protein B
VSLALAYFLIGFGLLAAGVLIGRYYVPDDRMLRRTARHARAYMRALNHLLARDREATVAELRQVVEENISDIEPYFALAALFRARGEWERAVRVHQGIELRPDADRATRLRARYELGLDYRAAAMPRRAVRALEDCLATDIGHEGALVALCGLYESQLRYADAAEAWTRLDKLRGRRPSERIAHLWAAAAEQAALAGAGAEARRFLKRAGATGSGGPHLIAAAAAVAFACGDLRGAREQLRLGLFQAPELAACWAPALLDLERAEAVADSGASGLSELPAERRDAIERVATDRTARLVGDAIAELGPSPYLALARAQLRAATDLDGALAEAREVCLEAPASLAARLTAARLALASGDPEAAQSELAGLIAQSGPLAQWARGAWGCASCGRLHDAFSWRCDYCRQWGTLIHDPERASDQPPRRDRRAEPRGRGEAVAGRSTLRAGTPPTFAARPRLIDRAGSWLSGALSGMRGRKRLAPYDDDPPQLTE